MSQLPKGIEKISGFPNERRKMWEGLVMIHKPEECPVHEYFLHERVKSFNDKKFSRYVCHHCGDWFNYWD